MDRENGEQVAHTTSQQLLDIQVPHQRQGDVEKLARGNEPVNWPGWIC